MRLAIIGLAAVGLAGCATMGDDGGPGSGPMPMMCNAEKVQSYVGKQANADTGATILKQSGARTLRWGPPNAAWTMDYRQDRVNVQYDAGMTIGQITCG
ncbi:I78 family peptidase inhibitor [Erythrobacter dokdonensis]|uniref:Peptidase inhibitor I78 family n=1 Tax=Erythrobacter dokdonensis DSW-74 TaxID=1300349 RepID=A0A1A7BF81_9SPHN|nr:I78 family peptidase inhibitor [Erythrobacter dokdonensis]OBV11183.1 Peptidase inhibitor I78 family [Erythrobacter dokdonensis DSW-74]